MIFFPGLAISLGRGSALNMLGDAIRDRRGSSPAAAASA